MPSTANAPRPALVEACAQLVGDELRFIGMILPTVTVRTPRLTVLAVFAGGPRSGPDRKLRYQAETRGADKTVVIESGGSGRANR